MPSSPIRFRSLRVFLAIGWICCFNSISFAQFDFDKEPIEYTATQSSDAIAKLIAKLESGEAKLEWTDQQGWLPSLLEQLNVSTKSQVLTFSKTSLQIRHINPDTPRAIYFNDDVYLGWIPTGDLIELSAVDDQLGAVFYTIRQRSAAQPEIERDHSNCMTCHGTSKTQNVPGYLVRSVYPSRSGQPHYSMGSTTTSHRTELKDRFGGWYVTGDLGSARHRGNKFATKDPAHPFDWDEHQNIETLNSRLEIERYPEPTSDVAALMVLEHQTQMHNLITRANYETRQALHYQEVMNRVLEREPGYESETTVRRIRSVSENLLEYLLFVDEAPLPSSVTPGNNFVREFSQLGPRDTQGRSLRDFQLEQRLFRYPCSFLIYSSTYDHLPSRVRDYVEERLIDILTGSDDSKTFSHLSADDRRTILEILVETKPGFSQRVQAR